MKKVLFPAFIALLSQTFLNAQTSVTNAATLGQTSPSSACLACAGSIWNNEMNITALDGTPSDIDLENYGFCFQSTCHYSRFLHARQFGFSIPASATILGIEVNIVRKAPLAGIIKDTIVQLIQSMTVMSPDYSAPGYWPATYTSQVYGGPADLWGLTWTPAQINAPGTTVALKISNNDASTVTGTMVDYVSMSVYYSTATGVVEVQTSAPNAFTAYQSAQNAISVSFVASKQTNSGQLRVFDITGKMIGSKELGSLNVGAYQETIYMSRLTSGIYLVQYTDGSMVVTRKVTIQN